MYLIHTYALHSSNYTNTLFACRPEGAELSPLVLRASEKKNGRSQKKKLAVVPVIGRVVGRSDGRKQTREPERRKQTRFLPSSARPPFLSLSLFLSFSLSSLPARSLAPISSVPTVLKSIVVVITTTIKCVVCVERESAREQDRQRGERGERRVRGGAQLTGKRRRRRKKNNKEKI